jgi:hypothetical protein
VPACLYADRRCQIARGFKTGGRQKGTPNKTTLVKRARAQEGLRRAEERGITPLDIMLSFMRGEGKYTREEYRGARDARTAAASAAVASISATAGFAGLAAFLIRRGVRAITTPGLVSTWPMWGHTPVIVRGRKPSSAG